MEERGSASDAKPRATAAPDGGETDDGGCCAATYEKYFVKDEVYIDVTALYPPEYWDALRRGDSFDPNAFDDVDRLQEKYARNKNPNGQAAAGITKPFKLQTEEATENLNFLTTAQRHLKDKFSSEEEVFETMVHMASVTQGYMLKDRFPQTSLFACFSAFAPQLRYFDASRKKDEWVLDWYIDKDYRDELRATQQYSVNDDRGTVPFRMMKRVWKGQSDYRHQILILFNEYDPRTDMAKNDRDTKKLEITCQGERDCGIWCRILKMFVQVAKQEHVSSLKTAKNKNGQRGGGESTQGQSQWDESEMGFFDEHGNWVDAETGVVTKAEDMGGHWGENGEWIDDDDARATKNA